MCVCEVFGDISLIEVFSSQLFHLLTSVKCSGTNLKRFLVMFAADM